jgi:hypothetical protein
VPRLYDINGTKKWLFYANEIEKILGLPPKKLRHWLYADKCLPETPLTDNTRKKSRLYCWEQTEAIVIYLAWKVSNPEKRRSYFNTILDDWMKIPIFQGLSKEDFARPTDVEYKTLKPKYGKDKKP